MPDLSLVYSAQRGETSLGSGWQFGFLSSIERRAPGGGTPDMSAVLDDPSTDFEFRVDGALLSPDPSGDGTWRAEHDAFTIYEPEINWALIERVVAWRVRRNGIVRTYGSGAESGLCQSGIDYATSDCTEPVRWHLTRIENAHGNAIDIAYRSRWSESGKSLSSEAILTTLEGRTGRILDKRFPGGSGALVRPREGEVIGAGRVGPARTAMLEATRRTVEPVTGELERALLESDTNKLLPVRLLYNDGRHAIELVHEERPDVRSERRDGIARTLSRRVSRIEVTATRDGVEHLAYSYRLNYLEAASDGRSLLKEIRREAVEPPASRTGESVLLRHFEYDDRPLDELDWEGWQPLALEGESLVPEHYDFSDEFETRGFSSISLLVNVDGDAQPDLIVLNTDCEADSSGSAPGQAAIQSLVPSVGRYSPWRPWQTPSRRSEWRCPHRTDRLRSSHSTPPSPGRRRDLAISASVPTYAGRPVARRSSEPPAVRSLAGERHAQASWSGRKTDESRRLPDSVIENPSLPGEREPICPSVRKTRESWSLRAVAEENATSGRPVSR